MLARLSRFTVAASLVVLCIAVTSEKMEMSHVGFNYALKLQTDPMDTKVAAEILSRNFPKVKKAKLFGSAEKDLEDARALIKVGITDITVAITQWDVFNGSVDVEFAKRFVDNVVLTLQAEGGTVSVAIGNEPFASWHNTPNDVLVTAYKNVRNALIDAGIKDSVHTTVPFQMGIIANSYPPSAAIFQEKFRPAIEEITALMYEDGDPFEMNVYPYFPFRENPNDISLDYALGNKGTAEYGSLFEAMYASVEFALQKLNANFTQNSPLVVGEVGWPTQDRYFPAEWNGWRNDTGFPHASVENAQIFWNNLLATGIPVYAFSAFDEQTKSVDSGAGNQFSDVENHWGIFYENGTLKYDIPMLMGDSLDESVEQKSIETDSGEAFELETSVMKKGKKTKAKKAQKKDKKNRRK